MLQQSEGKRMAETVNHAKHEVHRTRQEQREKAAAFWQDTVNQGRQLRQADERVRAPKQTRRRGADRDRDRDDDD
jgi:hypothetical protein